MKFVLDHDVSAQCLAPLRAAGHDAWTAEQAKMDTALDDDLVVYADQRNAVFITQDRGIVALRWDAPMTRILRLKCQKPLAAQVLEACLGDVIGFFERHQCVIVVASRRSNGKIRYQVSRGG